MGGRGERGVGRKRGERGVGRKRGERGDREEERKIEHLHIH